MNFYEKTGKMALGSRLRRLSDQVTEQAAGIYDLYQVDLQPKWFPVFYALSEGAEKSITDIAREIGHTHPSVSQIVREMVAKGYLIEKKGSADGRKNFVVLSEEGQRMMEKMQDQLKDVTSAIENAMKETQYDLWKAIAEWEFLLDQKSLLRRVQEEKKLRESQDVQMVDFEPRYAQAFRQLNEEWITTWFKMEEEDYHALDHPQEHILDGGGHIYIALYKGEPVGACAIIKMNDGGFELAKMGVSPKAKGKGIGWLLGRACLEKARELGAHRVYLESNTRLKPAISLYHKLGFRKIAGPPSPYERCDIQMELILKP
ncbi:GNAT family N-acetyltransferase [Flavitalea sp. BT771]|uniref:bifunctional helix-turn-helix transcriptional regulator/GNAT family N-acetyltransferase n=1 Tax=Flavitalea sp. BT771 TaxID=3063329 RepID=UPI0026E3478F|nr:GNAT family N-acetyltransferase [Flavitalea sp. BT771]MDO6433894.1 GNAT family N-acetyltransferase [Flavitalea sp. BT771]MDV6222201.1 GNAT family N-acetyltransferase [Flavitalea sp. BT771]